MVTKYENLDCLLHAYINACPLGNSQNIASQDYDLRHQIVWQYINSKKIIKKILSNIMLQMNIEICCLYNTKFQPCYICNIAARNGHLKCL